jgi:hypothetical protein
LRGSYPLARPRTGNCRCVSRARPGSRRRSLLRCCRRR